jgi:cobalamin biosynthesis protein CobD/CbiB
VLPLFWGLVLGAGGALAALCLQELARQIDEDKTDDPFWQPVRRIADWIALPPCWLALVFIQATIPFSGGRRGAAMAGFLNRFREEPLDRVAAAVAYGLDLGPSAAGHADGAKVSPPDLQRATVLLWTSTGLAAVTVALIGSVVYRFIL